MCRAQRFVQAIESLCRFDEDKGLARALTRAGSFDKGMQTTKGKAGNGNVFLAADRCRRRGIDRLAFEPVSGCARTLGAGKRLSHHRSEICAFERPFLLDGEQRPIGLSRHGARPNRPHSKRLGSLRQLVAGRLERPGRRALGRRRGVVTRLIKYSKPGSEKRSKSVAAFCRAVYTRRF